MTEPEDYQHQKSGYYAKDHLLSDFLSTFLDLADRTVLIAGCGRGQALVENDFWHGFDFNPNLKPLWEELGVSDQTLTADARSLPYFDAFYDFTISTDFLEHLKPDDIPSVASELMRVAPRGRHVIHAHPESFYRTTKGETLHPAGHLTRDDWMSHFPGSFCQQLEGRSVYLLLGY